MWIWLNGLFYIYAEYNPVWCYMGWWLYAAPIVTDPRHDRGVIDREEWPERDNAVWVNYDWRLDALMKGLGLPELHDYRGTAHTKSIRSFLEKYPIGVLCQVKDDGRKFEIVDSADLWDYSRIVKELHLQKWAEASGKHQDQLEELERQVKNLMLERKQEMPK